jgi:hypothetical protein
MLAGKELIFQTTTLFAAQAGGENMAVFTWRENK